MYVLRVPVTDERHDHTRLRAFPTSFRLPPPPQNLQHWLMLREKASVIQNPNCCDGNSCINICLICRDLSIITLFSDHSMVLQRSKHSQSPTHLWFHLGRWLHSQLYVPSGHTWSIPVKEMCTVSKEGKEKLCIPQEGKERLRLVANCKGYGKTACALLWLVMPKQTMTRRSLNHSQNPSPATNSDCRFSSSTHLIYMTDFLCGCIFTSWAYPTAFLSLSEL